MTGQEDPQTTQEVKKYLQQSHDRIFENNKKWAEEMQKKKPEFFKDLSAGQAPDYLWIGESTAHFIARIPTIELASRAQMEPEHLLMTT
jgi:carbonic anhydrase